MPFGDRTGPWGFGPMSGRAAGYCAGYGVPGRMSAVPRRGGGLGAGRGSAGGWRFRRWATRRGAPPYWGTPDVPAYGLPYARSYAPEDEVTVLKDQARYLEEALQEVKKRLEEIESSAEKD